MLNNPCGRISLGLTKIEYIYRSDVDITNYDYPIDIDTHSLAEEIPLLPGTAWKPFPVTFKTAELLITSKSDKFDDIYNITVAGEIPFKNSGVIPELNNLRDRYVLLKLVHDGQTWLVGNFDFPLKLNLIIRKNSTSSISKLAFKGAVNYIPAFFN